ncbi:hypothetical protein TNCV_2093891 [Trichonephila clavipes]|nr:hypothetical protein TNCV_2093891 [Trichonephila clavipes]
MLPISKRHSSADGDVRRLALPQNAAGNESRKNPKQAKEELLLRSVVKGAERRQCVDQSSTFRNMDRVDKISPTDQQVKVQPFEAQPTLTTSAICCGILNFTASRTANALTEALRSGERSQNNQARSPLLLRFFNAVAKKSSAQTLGKNSLFQNYTTMCGTSLPNGTISSSTRPRFVEGND